VICFNSAVASFVNKSTRILVYASTDHSINQQHWSRQKKILPVTKMVSPRLIIGQNNQAVAALEHGRHRDALLLMRAATMELNDLYQQGGAVEDDSSRRQKSSSPLRSGPVGLEPGATEGDTDDCSSMFRRAICLSRREKRLPVVAAVVLYNLALCEHVLGCFGASRRVVAALKFYKMSYQIIEENRQHISFGDLLILALINNIADASSRLHQMRKSRRWFKFLARILGVESSSSDGRIQPSLADEDYVFFYINAMLNNHEMSNAAPAA
jgi:hypothetical protein